MESKKASKSSQTGNQKVYKSPQIRLPKQRKKNSRKKVTTNNDEETKGNRIQKNENKRQKKRAKALKR